MKDETIHQYLAERKEMKQMQKLMNGIKEIVRRDYRNSPFYFKYMTGYTAAESWCSYESYPDRPTIKTLLQKFPELEYDFQVRENVPAKPHKNDALMQKYKLMKGAWFESNDYHSTTPYTRGIISEGTEDEKFEKSLASFKKLKGKGGSIW
jgi:hypothetical protein